MQDSVANWIDDAAKTRPEWAVGLYECWALKVMTLRLLESRSAPCDPLPHLGACVGPGATYCEGARGGARRTADPFVDEDELSRTWNRCRPWTVLMGVNCLVRRYGSHHGQTKAGAQIATALDSVSNPRRGWPS